MGYLVLAILSSAAVSIVMRLSNNYIRNNMVMFAANYIECGLLSYIFIRVDGGSGLGTDTLGSAADFFRQEGMFFAIALGAVSGILYLASFMLMQLNILKNGVVLSATFMKLGVVVPILMSVILGWDNPTAMQLGGCILTVIAIIVINGENTTEAVADTDGGEKHRAGNITWLVVMLILSGFSDSLANIYDKLGESGLKSHYLLYIFIFATVMSIIMIMVKKQHFTIKDAACGIVIGIPNYFSARFLLYALSQVSSIVVYPVYNICAIMLISLAGFVFFKEKLSRRKLCGLGIILLSIIALSIR